MNIEDFEVGDTVILKSGSPDMTVARVMKSCRHTVIKQAVVCVWFDTIGDCHEKDFDPEVLIRTGV